MPCIHISQFWVTNKYNIWLCVFIPHTHSGPVWLHWQSIALTLPGLRVGGLIPTGATHATLACTGPV